MGSLGAASTWRTGRESGTLCGMDEATVKAMLEKHFASSDPDVAHEMYHGDAVLEFPQSGERLVRGTSGVSILELRGDKIARESIYVTEGWEPPEWRAQWRSAP
jgi:hypothetical protein